MKRVAICFDGTWNRPEQILGEDFPTNVLQFARAIRPTDGNGVEQVVFYDWGIGSYHDEIRTGATGYGLEKQNARLIEQAFRLYKTKKHTANGDHSMEWKARHSVEQRTPIKFVGVWDTVGALGLPFTFFGLIKDRDLFYDRKIGSNIRVARHALSLDEQRKDFEPTLWDPRESTDLEQVWFAGVHSDVGGGYGPDKQGRTLADIPLLWMKEEAQKQALVFNDHLPTQTHPSAEQHNEYKGKYKLLGKRVREIPPPEANPTWVHPSVKARYDSGYRSKPIEQFIEAHGRWPVIWPE
jgi:uncharacterized protein (DUF2235 family)